MVFLDDFSGFDGFESFEEWSLMDFTILMG